MRKPRPADADPAAVPNPDAPPEGPPHAANDLREALALLPESLPFDRAAIDFARLPAGPGVFLLETRGEPFLGKSSALRRRLQRLLGTPGPAEAVQGAPGAPAPRRPRLNLRGSTTRIHYRATGSAFETSLLLYRAARAAFPDRYRLLLRLRVPPLLKLNLDNLYPRCYVTRRIGRGGLCYGPFPSRAAAEKLAPQFLDFFLVRRCVEEIRPDPAHPGCIYGEMKMCLRPCQAACTAEQYRDETLRLAAFLASGGESLLREIEGTRDRASEQLDFEEAAQLHRRAESVRDAFRQRPELACDLDALHGLVIQPSAAGAAAELFPVWRGFLLPQITFGLEVAEGKPVSMDARLREALAGIEFRAGSPRVRGEHLALLARWFYRGTRKGEFVAFDSFDKPPYRRLVNAIRRAVKNDE